jgi:hypothetical protein
MFLYFVPTDANQITAPQLRQLGLGYLGIKGNATARACRGPGDRPGLVFAGDGKAAAAYKPAEQDWMPGPDGKYFVGREQKNELPGPDELRKPRFVSGEDLTIGEQVWTVPVCLSLVRGATIPKALVLGPDGKTWTFGQLPEFAALCAAAARVHESLMVAAPAESPGDGAAEDGAERTRITLTDAADIAVQALGVNYRVGPVEASVLRLLTTETVRDVCFAIVDLMESDRVASAGGEKKDTPGT